MGSLGPPHLECVCAGACGCPAADAEKDTEIRLVRSGEVLNRHTIKNPMIVVCNYIFDTLRQDAFRIVEGQLQEGLCTVISDQPEPDLTNPDIIKRIRYGVHVLLRSWEERGGGHGLWCVCAGSGMQARHRPP